MNYTTDTTEAVRQAARQAAKATMRSMPKQGGFTQHDQAATAMVNAAKALHHANNGNLAAAGRAALKASDAHDAMGMDALQLSLRGDANTHERAGDLHRRVSQLCGGSDTLVGNERDGYVVERGLTSPTVNVLSNASPSLLQTLRNSGRTPVNNGLNVERVNDQTYPNMPYYTPGSGSFVERGLTSGDVAGSPGQHAFDQTLGQTGDDDSIDDQHGGYWSGSTKSPMDVLKDALEEDFLTEENRRRQGLDVPDTSMTSYYASRPDLYSDVYIDGPVHNSGSPEVPGMVVNSHGEVSPASVARFLAEENLYQSALTNNAALTDGCDPGPAYHRAEAAKHAQLLQDRHQLVANAGNTEAARMFGMLHGVTPSQFGGGAGGSNTIVGDVSPGLLKALGKSR
jgi:hypothetical protein